MKRQALILLVAIPVVLAGAVYGALSRLSIGEIIMCSSTPDTFSIPEPLCRLYLNHFTDSDDARELSERAGLAYAFEIENQDEKYAVITRLLEIGVDVNGVSKADGLTPINAAILLNDADLVNFLIAHGAMPDLPDRASGLNARMYVQFLQERKPEIDRSAVAKLLR